jgi:hypothetical protein
MPKTAGGVASRLEMSSSGMVLSGLDIGLGKQS